VQYIRLRYKKYDSTSLYLYLYKRKLKGLSHKIEGVCFAIHILKALFKSNNLRGKKIDFGKGPVRQLHVKDSALYQVLYSKQQGTYLYSKIVVFFTNREKNPRNPKVTTLVRCQTCNMEL